MLKRVGLEQPDAVQVQKQLAARYLGEGLEVPGGGAQDLDVYLSTDGTCISHYHHHTFTSLAPPPAYPVKLLNMHRVPRTMMRQSDFIGKLYFITITTPK